jgi:nucleoside-diphosphate-sugar epimerase
MTFSILRPSTIVGVGMSSRSFGEMLSIIKRGYFFYIGSKKSISTYVHVHDVVDALIVCAKNKKACNQIFNLSNDCNLSEIVNNVSHFSGFSPNFLCIPEKPLRFIV